MVCPSQRVLYPVFSVLHPSAWERFNDHLRLKIGKHILKPPSGRLPFIPRSMATRSVEGILCCVESSGRKRSLEKHHKMGVTVCGTVLNVGGGLFMTFVSP